MTNHLSDQVVALTLGFIFWSTAAWGQPPRDAAGSSEPTPGFRPGPADDQVTAGRFFVDPPTIHNLGFRWYIQGDSNRNASVSLAYRRKGDGQWRPAQPMLRVQHEVVNLAYSPWRCGNLFAGSVMDLEPRTQYEVRLTMHDPDGGAPPARTVTVTTAVEPPRFEGQRQLEVFPAGRGEEIPDGSFGDLAEALERARPGDVVLVQPGIHWGNFVLETSGRPKQPIVIRGAGDGTSVIESSNHREALFDVSGADHIHFENLTLRRARVAIDGGSKGGTGSVGLVVRRCRIEDVVSGVWTSSENARNWFIADNVLIGMNPTWHPRTAPGRTYMEPSHTGINLYGRGHVVAYNQITRFSDSLAIANYGPPVDDLDKHCVNIDFYNNDLSWAQDDTVETDYGGHNIRVYRNRCYNSHTALSAQPTYGGPIYLIRNAAYGITSIAFKLHNYCTGIVAYHNTTCTARRAGLASFDRWQNGHFRNNLILGPGGALATGSITPYTTLDYNGYKQNEREPLIRWFDGETRHRLFSLEEFAEATGHERHGIVLDYDVFARADEPQVGVTSDPDEWDLRLRPGSAAVDAGIRLPNVNDLFTADAPDLGAYETSQPVPHYGPRNN